MGIKRHTSITKVKKINTVLTSVSATFSDQEMTRQTGSRDIHPCFSLSGSVLISLKKNHINHQLGHIYIYIYIDSK